MQPLKAADRTYEVERRAYHAARPGFRIRQHLDRIAILIWRFFCRDAFNRFF